MSRGLGDVYKRQCTYYANGFIWGADEDENYVSELKRIKGMIVAYVRNGEP